MSVQQYDVPQGGVYSGNQQDFLFQGNLITHPKISHFHRARSLSFDGVVRNAYGGGIVAMNGCFWLRMAQFFKGHTRNDALFAVQEKGA